MCIRDRYNQFTEVDDIIAGSYLLTSLDNAIGDVVKITTVGSGGWLLLEKVADEDTEDYTVNLKGGPLKGIPEEKYTIRVTYEMDSRFGPMWWLLSHSYTGDFSASGVQRPLDRVESRETTNLSISWYSNDGATSVRAYVNNLMDNENYYALSTGDHETNYRKSVTALPPRTMGVDMRYRI